MYTKKLLNLYKNVEEKLLLACVSLIYFPTFSQWEIGQNQTKKILIKPADQIWINMWLSKLDQVAQLVQLSPKLCLNIVNLTQILLSRLDGGGGWVAGLINNNANLSKAELAAGHCQLELEP